MEPRGREQHRWANREVEWSLLEKRHEFTEDRARQAVEGKVTRVGVRVKARVANEFQWSEWDGRHGR